jgi:DNA-binding winged helix-turn-helix (wHTH) protein
VQDLWPENGASPHTVDVTVARLRRRLGPTGAAIRTVPRRGYWLDAVRGVGRQPAVQLAAVTGSRS